MSGSPRALSLATWLALLAVSTGAACGGGGITLDVAEQRVLVALCKAEVSCGAMPDLATCLASLQDEPGYQATLDADIASGKVIWDAGKASTCIAAFERVYGGDCSRSALSIAPGSLDQSCAGIFTGTVPAGGPCFFNEECAGGGSCQSTATACSRSQQCCPGTCVAKPAPIPVGGDCSNLMPNQSCATGSYCTTAASGGSLTCVVPTTVAGSACTSSTQCAAPLYCDFAAGSSAGTCKRSVATGTACNTNVGSISCDFETDYCDTTTGTCTPKIEVNGTCDPTQYNCVGLAECQGTTCVARLRAGQSCDPASGPSCLGSLTCDATTRVCTLRPVGGVCM